MEGDCNRQQSPGFILISSLLRAVLGFDASFVSMHTKTAKDKLKTDYEDGLNIGDALKLAASVSTIHLCTYVFCKCGCAILLLVYKLNVHLFCSMRRNVKFCRC